MNLDPTVVSRFWSKVRKTSGCWNWSAGLFSSGYGQFSLNRRSVKAHRFSWMLHHGEIPGHLIVRHKCHNKICVNPDHLMLGTQADNVRDRQEAKRQARGDKLSHLSPEIVIQIFEADGSNKDLARKFNVSSSTVGNIKNGLTWSHVTRNRKRGGHSYLPSEDVIAIYNSTANVRKIAKDFGIGKSQVYNIKNKICWKELLDNADRTK